RLIEENQKRSTLEREFELLDTGIFDEDRYFDIFIEYAKATPDDLCIRLEVFNRGPEAAPIHVLPQLWFRNQWSWGPGSAEEPVIHDCSSRGNEALTIDESHSNKADQSLVTSAATICLGAQEAKWEPQSMLPIEYKLGRRLFYAPPGGQPLFT